MGNGDGPSETGVSLAGRAAVAAPGVVGEKGAGWVGSEAGGETRGTPRRPPPRAGPAGGAALGPALDLGCISVESHPPLLPAAITAME